MIDPHKLIEHAREEIARTGDPPTWENIAGWLSGYACGLLEDNARLMRGAVRGHIRGKPETDIAEKENGT